MCIILYKFANSGWSVLDSGERLKYDDNLNRPIAFSYTAEACSEARALESARGRFDCFAPERHCSPKRSRAPASRAGKVACGKIHSSRGVPRRV